MSNNEQLNELKTAQKSLRDLYAVDGVAAANRAVANCAPDSSIIFLTKSQYEDLLAKTALGELKRYKNKVIFITSDDGESGS